MAVTIRSAGYLVAFALCAACPGSAAPENSAGTGGRAGTSSQEAGDAGQVGAGRAAKGGSSAAGHADKITCDPRKILCKRAAPSCGQFEVRSVDGSCYGPCVSIQACPCTGPEECPDSNQYTCHMSTKHCTPYL